MINKHLLFLGFLFVSVNSFGQSPWVDDKGSIYAQAAGTFITYEGIFDSDGNGSENQFETSDRTFGLFASYSVTNKTGLQVNLPFKSVSANDSTLNALGDISVKVKHELFQSFPLTAFAGYTAPTSTREGVLRTGYNQHSIDLGLSTGFSKNSTFGYLGVGHRSRVDIPNQIIIDTEIGTQAKIGERSLFLIFHIDGALNLEDIEDPEADQTVLYHNNGQYLSPGIKISLNVINDWFINFGTYGAITATNQGAAPSLTIGIAYNRKNFQL